MKTSDFNYNLPKEFIAQVPIKERQMSKLLLLNKETGKIEHKIFKDILDYLKPQDTLVLNNTKVLPARIFGKKENSDKKLEVLLLKEVEKDIWQCLLKPARKILIGEYIIFLEGRLKAKVCDIIEDGIRILEFEYIGIFNELLDEIGTMPLPPYITHKLDEQDRYQTIYSQISGSAAAPTAGLHFTKELLSEIEKKGVNIVYVTLHVGLGTFRPVKVENVLEHKMHSEYYEISKEACDTINNTKKIGGKVIAVGTTSCRVLESATADDNKIYPRCEETDIFIYPGYKFKMIDALISNFHLPESTLLMLVSAFSKREYIFDAYEEAKKNNYRFFSFGDAMYIF